MVPWKTRSVSWTAVAGKRPLREYASEKISTPDLWASLPKFFSQSKDRLPPRGGLFSLLRGTSVLRTRGSTLLDVQRFRLQHSFQSESNASRLTERARRKDQSIVLPCTRPGPRMIRLLETWQEMWGQYSVSSSSNIRINRAARARVRPGPALGALGFARYNLHLHVQVPEILTTTPKYLSSLDLLISSPVSFRFNKFIVLAPTATARTKVSFFPLFILDLLPKV